MVGIKKKPKMGKMKKPNKKMEALTISARKKRY